MVFLPHSSGRFLDVECQSHKKQLPPILAAPKIPGEGHALIFIESAKARATLPRNGYGVVFSISASLSGGAWCKLKVDSRLTVKRQWIAMVGSMHLRSLLGIQREITLASRQ
jgi:hypothetical protein